MIEHRSATHRRRPKATPRLEPLEPRTVPSAYGMSLVDQTGLGDSAFSIYVNGFSKGSGLTLQPAGASGVLAFGPQAGTVSSYRLGVGADLYDSIRFDASQPVIGARIYFFVVPAGGQPPSFPFGTQPANPPGSEYLYSYVELTQPAGGGPPTVDVATVDGFSFPVTLTLNSGLGQVGQPTSGPAGTRPEIIAAYQDFMAPIDRAAYRALVLPASSKAAGQSEGLLNPYAYLTAPSGEGPLPANVGSVLNRSFDAALGVLFGRSGWSLMGVDSNVYTASAGTYPYGSLTNPVTGAPVKLAGLQFQGGGNTLRVFNPVGVSTFVGANGGPITGTTPVARPRGPRARRGAAAPQLDTLVLTNAPAAGVLKPGTFVFGAYFDQVDGRATNYVTSVRTLNGRTLVKLSRPLPFAVDADRLVFSQLPYLPIMVATSGAMVYGGSGFFADAALQGVTGPQATILGNLQNQINAALNRGVAAAPSTRKVPGPLAASGDGQASRYWGTESNWYPPGQPQNAFSLFMHTATVAGDPIFLRPANPASTAGGAPMGSAYGFAYDEDPGPVPPAPSGQPRVPSKFDPVPPGVTNITVTLGPWSSGS